MWPRSRIHSSSGGTSESCSNWARVRLLFLRGTRSILHPYLNMRMDFIVLRKGPLFEVRLICIYEPGSTVIRSPVRWFFDLEAKFILHLAGCLLSFLLTIWKGRSVRVCQPSFADHDSPDPAKPRAIPPMSRMPPSYLDLGRWLIQGSTLDVNRPCNLPAPLSNFGD